MNRLRRMPTRRLLALCAGVVAALIGGTAVALAALGGSGEKPPAKPLAAAVHDALGAPPLNGVSARIRFTNRLIDSSSLQGTDPLITGATGRLWIAADGRARLELQSDQGDANIATDGKTVTVYDGPSNTVYTATLPKDSKQTKADHAVPSIARIQKAITDLMRRADLSGAVPSNVAGQPAYTVRISPKHDGGLIGAGKLAWDAATGAPLRAAIYAAGDSKPTLELTATKIHYGPVSASDLVPSRPKGAKVVHVALPAGNAKAGAAKRHAKGTDVTGAAAVAAKLPFTLSAPKTLVGLPRHEVRLLDAGKEKGAVVTYGANLGGIVVIERPASAKQAAAPRKGDRHQPGVQFQLPSVSIDGATGQELATALGTVVRFDRAGVEYIVAGSIPPAAAEAAARGL